MPELHISPEKKKNGLSKQVLGKTCVRAIREDLASFMPQPRR